MATSIGPRTADLSGSALRAPILSPVRAHSAAPLPWRRYAGAITRGALILSDAMALFLAAFAIYWLRAVIWGPMPFSIGMWVGTTVWFFLRAESGLYGDTGTAPPEQLRRSSITTIAAGLTHAAALFFLQVNDASRFLALGIWLLLVGLAWILRDSVKNALVRRRLFGRPVIIIGAGRTAALAIRELRAHPTHGLQPVAVFDDDPARHGAEVEGVPVLGSVADAIDWEYPYAVRNALVALPGAGGARAVEIGHALARRYPSTAVVPDLIGLSSLWAKTRSFGSVVTLEIEHARFEASSLRLKRAFDIVVGFPIFLAALPVIGVCALLVKLTSRGPAFYHQEREGLGRKRIRVWKIRTMVPNAEQRLADYLQQDPLARLQWERYMKLARDPRIIPVVGAFLRRYSLDELPQLWNVIRGDMSLVGPRPFPDYHLSKFSAGFRELRCQVPPGVTGYWQVTDRSNADLPRQQIADSYYVHNWSLWLDVWIVFRTFSAVVSGAGAY